jgi:hypothetical protein
VAVHVFTSLFANRAAAAVDESDCETIVDYHKRLGGIVRTADSLSRHAKLRAQVGGEIDSSAMELTPDRYSDETK